MTRAVVIIADDAQRHRLIGWIRRAPWNTRVELKAPRRSLPQNDLMWLWLTAIASKLDWHGQRYTAEDWKDYMMHAYRRARWMPSEDGGMIPIGMRTSDLSKPEMSELVELIIEFAARHNVAPPEITSSGDADRANNPAAVAA